MGRLRFLGDDAWRRFHLATGNAELVDELELTPQVRAGDFTAHELAVARQRPRDLFGALIDEFDAEAAGAKFDQPGDIFGTGLGAVIEDRVAAAGVGLEREFGADPITEGDPVGVAGPTAVAVVFPLGQKRAEHTMLHMKHRHMQMRTYL